MFLPERAHRGFSAASDDTAIAWRRISAFVLIRQADRRA